MKKYIKYAPIFILGFIIMTSVSHAESLPTSTTSAPSTRQLIDNARNDTKNNIEQTKDIFKDQISKNKTNLNDTIQQGKDALKNLLPSKEDLKNLTPEQIAAIRQELDQKRVAIKNTIEQQRNQFKSEIELKKGEMQKNIDASKEKLKKDILKIKDDKKKETVQNIITKIADLNTKAVSNLNDLIDNIEDNLGKIEAQTNEEEAKGTDVTATRDLIIKAKTAISDDKAAIIIQSTKIYSANITTDSMLQGTMRKVKESLNTDIKVLREIVRTAHTLTKEAVMSLPQNSVEDQAKVDNNTNPKVEEGNTPTSNTTN